VHLSDLYLLQERPVSSIRIGMYVLTSTAKYLIRFFTFSGRAGISGRYVNSM